MARDPDEAYRRFCTQLDQLICVLVAEDKPVSTDELCLDPMPDAYEKAGLTKAAAFLDSGRIFLMGPEQWLDFEASDRLRSIRVRPISVTSNYVELFHLFALSIKKEN